MYIKSTEHQRSVISSRIVIDPTSYTDGSKLHLIKTSDDVQLVSYSWR